MTTGAPIQVQPSASPGKRLAAQIIDLVFVIFPLNLTLGAGLANLSRGETMQQRLFMLLGSLAVLIVVAGLQLWCWAQSRSIGKWILGLRVVRRSDGARAGFPRIIVRSLVKVMGFFLLPMPFYGIFGVLFRGPLLGSLSSNNAGAAVIGLLFFPPIGFAIALVALLFASQWTYWDYVMRTSVVDERRQKALST